MTRNEILSEIIRVDAELNSDSSKGKRTILKSYQRKLYAQYRRAA